MMFILKIATVLCLLAYILYLLRGVIGFSKTKTFVPDPSQNKTKTCIIICARNEEQTIERCLKGILEQDFDMKLVEILFFSDGSTDNTFSVADNILKQYPVCSRLFKIEKSQGKKRCITSGITLSQSELIICRDADTYTENNQWLKTIVSFYEEKGNQFIIAPIEMENKNGFLAQLQHYENSALVIITGGYAFYKKAFLCNGANLAFTKNIFNKVGGYKSHLEINSGDDVLFLEDVKKADPETVAYLKNPAAAVTTYPLKSFKKLMEQKVRWASKFDKNPNQINAFLGLIVCLVHVFCLFYLIKPIFTHHIPLFGIIFICLRVLIDFLLLFLASRYYNRPLKWLWFLPLSVFYSFYVILTTLLSLVVKQNRK